MILNTVINKDTKRVKRWGYCDFTASPEFNPETEEVIEKEFLFDGEKELIWYWIPAEETFKQCYECGHLDDYKNIRYEEINAKDLVIFIRDGFVYDDTTFSLSPASREQYQMFSSMRLLLTYPTYVDKKDESEAPYEIVDADAMLAFLGTAMGTVSAVAASGEALKAQIRAVATKAEVDAIIDNR